MAGFCVLAHPLIADIFRGAYTGRLPISTERGKLYMRRPRASRQELKSQLSVELGQGVVYAFRLKFGRL